MNVICKLRGHKTVYRFVADRFEVTVPGDAPTAVVMRLAFRCEATTSVRQVCTRCGVVVWERDTASALLSQDQQGSRGSAPHSTPVSPSAWRSGRNPRLCDIWVIRNNELTRCGAVLLPGGGCGNAHRHFRPYQTVYLPGVDDD